MPRTVAIVQSNYIPWKGYFDLIRSSDEFIFFDDVQYTRRDWRNRNRIKTKDGLLWLSIPVQSKGRYHDAISDMVVSDPDWARRHWKTITTNYARALHFKDYADLFAPLYLNSTETYLVDINFNFIQTICGILGISTKLSKCSDYELVCGRTERIVHLCRQARADRYLSGPSARSYLDSSLFAAAGIELVFVDYSGYPEYPQLYQPFEHNVSIIDLIFNQGSAATHFMLTF
ncbi:MAG TPA: WbqC family protein [Methylomirabilota bacterium]|nr:WbqC family protein [Methylomirabilota bacterium]